MKQLKYCFAIVMSFIFLFFIVNRLASNYCNQEIERTSQNTVSNQFTVSDQQLISMTIDRVCKKYRDCKNESEALHRMTEGERAVYCTNNFYFNMKENGLCNYFSQSQISAQYILDSLSEIKADPYEESLHIFVSQNEINLEDLSEFAIYSESQQQNLIQKYPFQEFDGYYDELEEEKSLDTYIADYIRENMTDL